MLTQEERNREMETDQIAREFFAGNESPLCPRCGEELLFRLDYELDRRPRLRMSCVGCGLRFSWRQEGPPGEWEPLHMTYFVERVAQGQVPRCPIDDSGISFAEFEGGILEFRCPYCNRRGRVEAPEISARLHLGENESIVFLTV